MTAVGSLLSSLSTIGRLFLVADRKRRTTRMNMMAYTAATARGRAVPITFRPPPLSAQVMGHLLWGWVDCRMPNVLSENVSQYMVVHLDG